jgi:putative Mg2+ transporter-C (MgtC) family protein
MSIFSPLQQLWHPSAQLLLVAALLGALIGLEREMAGKDPSLRTFSLISLGSCLFSLLSIQSALGVPNAEPSRIAAQIVVGIGFLGAGTIFRSRHGVSGLTTAALMWVTAGIGMAVGFGRVDLAVSATILAVIITMSFTLVHRTMKKERSVENPPVEHPEPTEGHK